MKKLQYRIFECVQMHCSSTAVNMNTSAIRVWEKYPILTLIPEANDMA